LFDHCLNGIESNGSNTTRLSRQFSFRRSHRKPRQPKRAPNHDDHNAEEYEVVEDEEEWEEEEYDEVSWVSGAESFYDEETVEGSQRLSLASFGGGGIGGASL
jgi:hypothetical protein